VAFINEQGKVHLLKNRNSEMQAVSHVESSLKSLSSFSHARCDALLQRSYITIPNAYNPGKFPYDFVYIGLWISLGWEAAIIVITIVAWRRKRMSGKSIWSEQTWLIWRYVGPIFFLFGLVGLYAQVLGMAQYSDTCRRLLSL
jgi:hypothetical protein